MLIFNFTAKITILCLMRLLIYMYGIKELVNGTKQKISPETDTSS